jgi:hypothetical protein
MKLNMLHVPYPPMALDQYAVPQPLRYNWPCLPLPSSLFLLFFIDLPLPCPSLPFLTLLSKIPQHGAMAAQSPNK